MVLKGPLMAGSSVFSVLISTQSRKELSWRDVAMDESANSVLEQLDIEVHDQSDGVFRDLEISLHLSLVNRVEFCDCFELDDDFLLDNHVQAISTV
jgi:hypothetical protein